VRHLVVGRVLEMKLDRVALAYADEAARHGAAKCPVRVGHAFGDRHFLLDHFQLDDHLGGMIAMDRRRHVRWNTEHRVNRLALRRPLVARCRGHGSGTRCDGGAQRCPLAVCRPKHRRQQAGAQRNGGKQA